jgi:integrase
MAIRKLRNSLWVDLRYNRKRYRLKSPDNSIAGARAYEAALRHKLAQGETLDESDPQKRAQGQVFAEWAWRWYEGYAKTNNKYAERRTKEYVLRLHLVPFFGKIPLDRITVQHIEQFKAHQIEKGLKNKTTNNHLAILNKCLSTAQEWLELEKVPKVKWLKCPPTDTDFLTPEESELLLSYADGIWREMILTTLRTGLRHGELKAIQWQAINWEKRVLTVRYSWCDVRKALDTPKSNRMRYIPIHNDVYDILYKRYKPSGFVFTDSNNEPLTQHMLNRKLKRICRKARIREISWHTLRHTFASHMAMASVPLSAVQVLLGHTDIRTTMRYAHLSPSTLRTAIDALDYREVGPVTQTQDANFGQPAGNAF